MLLNENKPFADHHRERLTAAETKLQGVRDNTENLSLEELDEIIRDLRQARYAFDRYEACFADEVAQKNRMKPAFLRERGLKFKET